MLTAAERAALCANIAASLERVTEDVVVSRVMELLRRFDGMY